MNLTDRKLSWLMPVLCVASIAAVKPDLRAAVLWWGIRQKRKGLRVAPEAFPYCRVGATSGDRRSSHPRPGVDRRRA